MSQENKPSKLSSLDIKNFMLLAYELAKKGEGFVNPNPMVGAVLVKNGRVIGKGYHQKYGGDHAEIMAIKNSIESPVGSTLICTLEPCCHTKKQTPPCIQAIVKNKIKEVHIGMLDPNPQVAGKGLRELESHGIKTSFSYLEERLKELNSSYIYFMKHKRPFVHLKIAQTLDGNIATRSNDSKWITSPDLRKWSHRLRGSHQAILVGKNTAIYDNPKLSVRHGLNNKFPDPLKIVLADYDHLPEGHHLKDIEKNHGSPIWFASNKKQHHEGRVKTFNLSQPPETNFYNLNELLEKCGQLKINSLLVEGGRGVYSSFLKENLVQKITFVMAPKILGDGLSPFENIKMSSVSDSLRLSHIQVKTISDHLIVEGFPTPN